MEFDLFSWKNYWWIT